MSEKGRKVEPRNFFDENSSGHCVLAIHCSCSYFLYHGMTMDAIYLCLEQWFLLWPFWWTSLTWWLLGRTFLLPLFWSLWWCEWWSTSGISLFVQVKLLLMAWEVVWLGTWSEICWSIFCTILPIGRVNIKRKFLLSTVKTTLIWSAAHVKFTFCAHWCVDAVPFLFLPSPLFCLATSHFYSLLSLPSDIAGPGLSVFHAVDTHWVSFQLELMGEKENYAQIMYFIFTIQTLTCTHPNPLFSTRPLRAVNVVFPPLFYSARARNELAFHAILISTLNTWLFSSAPVPPPHIDMLVFTFCYCYCVTAILSPNPTALWVPSTLSLLDFCDNFHVLAVQTVVEFSFRLQIWWSFFLFHSEFYGESNAMLKSAQFGLYHIHPFVWGNLGTICQEPVRSFFLILRIFWRRVWYGAGFSYRRRMFGWGRDAITSNWRVRFTHLSEKRPKWTCISRGEFECGWRNIFRHWTAGPCQYMSTTHYFLVRFRALSSSSYFPNFLLRKIHSPPLNFGRFSGVTDFGAGLACGPTLSKAARTCVIWSCILHFA